MRGTAFRALVLAGALALGGCAEGDPSVTGTFVAKPLGLNLWFPEGWRQDERLGGAGGILGADVAGLAFYRGVDPEHFRAKLYLSVTDTTALLAEHEAMTDERFERIVERTAQGTLGSLPESMKGTIDARALVELSGRRVGRSVGTATFQGRKLTMIQYHWFMGPRLGWALLVTAADPEGALLEGDAIVASVQSAA